MYQYVYLEINALCIILLLFILFRMRRDIDRQAACVSFVQVVFCVLVALMLDIFGMLTEGQPSEILRVCNVLLNVWSLIQTSLISWCWMQYVEAKLERTQAHPSRLYHILRPLPLAALGILAMTSPWTGLLFYVDEFNIYHRGPLYAVQVLVAYFYIALSLAEAVGGIRRATYHQKKTDAYTLLSFFILPAIGGLLSARIYGLPATWPLTTVSLLMIYVKFQDDQISTDALTGLNNRRQFDRRLRILAGELHGPERLYLLLMDVDSFKKINDTYGHYEGDRALIETASLLKRACKGDDLFLARYGGDEFAILFLSGDRDRPQELKGQIGRLFAERNAAARTPYSITLSIGIEAYRPGRPGAIPALISGADKALYQEKAVGRGQQRR